MKLLINLSIAAMMTFALNGCSSKPTHLELDIKSSHDLNPDLNNVSSPLMLTFYELESAESFLKYDYWTLSANSGENLKQDLISQAKHIIVPQQKQNYKIVFNKNTKFLGVVGKFRNISNTSKWKYVINLEQEKYNYSELKIGNFSIEREK